MPVNPNLLLLVTKFVASLLFYWDYLLVTNRFGISEGISLGRGEIFSARHDVWRLTISWTSTGRRIHKKLVTQPSCVTRGSFQEVISPSPNHTKSSWLTIINHSWSFWKPWLNMLVGLVYAIEAWTIFWLATWGNVTCIIHKMLSNNKRGHDMTTLTKNDQTQLWGIIWWKSMEISHGYWWDMTWT